MSWTNIFMVPLVMACVLGGTVGIIRLIRRFALGGNGGGVKTGTSEGGSDIDLAFNGSF